ncbi:MAG: hypothetical protein Q9M31_08305 [Mariprofundus sp.]|nr:hypothetical protein [Mariprofundus sp.]
MPHTSTKAIPAAQLYGAISMALLIPLLLWPSLQGFTYNGLNPGQNIHLSWLIIGSALLISAVTADTIIAYKPGFTYALFGSGWILFATLSITISLRLPGSDWILATMFALHSLRSARPLWQNKPHWHLWPAWSRDTLASIALFTFPIILNASHFSL